jgi:hypothetical protein
MIFSMNRFPTTLSSVVSVCTKPCIDNAVKRVIAWWIRK